MAQIGTELGVPDPPRTEKELTERIASYRPELASTAEARAAARFLLLNPPLPVIARPPYGLLAAAAVSLPGASAAVAAPGTARARSAMRADLPERPRR